ncbi:MAG: LytTR family DNA-binding domain-containing protein [Alphaproteobacteria bacterium]|nr:LytTR family DNA-binding domain-containing protein [Alphaproteobacteria bacterium]
MAVEHWRTFAAAAVVGVFLALVGAFGTQTAPLLPRTLYWLTLMIGGSVVGVIVGAVTSRRPRLDENSVLRWAVIATAVTLLLTLFVWWLTGLMFAGRGPDTLPYFLGVTAIVTAPVTALMMVLNNPGPATHAAPSGAPAPRVRFLERLPPKLMGAVIHAVEAEDHYLRLHTSKGADLILCRLADAIAELEGVEGAQVHRSWWVAREAVTEVKRTDGRVTLVIPGGVETPVSRPNVKALKEAGWI